MQEDELIHMAFFPVGIGLCGIEANPNDDSCITLTPERDMVTCPPCKEILKVFEDMVNDPTM